MWGWGWWGEHGYEKLMEFKVGDVVVLIKRYATLYRIIF
jgi:hypothetical protein